MEKDSTGTATEGKRQAMFQSWLSPVGIMFPDPEAEKAYQTRVIRIIDVIRLKVPDRIPVIPGIGFFPAYYAGITPREAMYDYHKLHMAWKKYMLDFQPDMYTGMGNPTPGKVFDILDYKVYRWPGHGVPADTLYQCIEAEYMKADEYDLLIDDPTDFWLKVYLPRVFGALEPLKTLSSLFSLMEMPMAGPSLQVYGEPGVQAAFKSLLDAGKAAREWGDALKKGNREIQELGFPALTGGSTKAPFDTIGDTLRGTQGIMLDMYRCPDKLLEALERLVPLMVKMALGGARKSGIPLIFIPLHKGADGFMSLQQFKKFYWPTLRKVIIGLIEAGLVPLLFAEGSYNSRLEVIADLPPGTCIWKFDTTDMARAKSILNGISCIEGNVPMSLLATCTPQEVKDYCKKLINDAGKDGGFIMSNGVVIDRARPENIRAMIDFTKEYGRYS
jgi:uroporphyrinogen-III decarboxylase